MRGVAAAGLSRPRPRPRPRPRFDRKSFAAGCSLARQSGPCLHCSSMHTLTLLAAAGVVSCVMRCEMCHLSLSRSRSSGGTALEGTSGQWSNEPDHLTTLTPLPAEPSPRPPVPFPPAPKAAKRASCATGAIHVSSSSIELPLHLGVGDTFSLRSIALLHTCRPHACMHVVFDLLLGCPMPCRRVFQSLSIARRIHVRMHCCASLFSPATSN